MLVGPILELAIDKIIQKDMSGFSCSTLTVRSIHIIMCSCSLILLGAVHCVSLIPFMCPFYVDGLLNRFQLGVLQVFWYVCVSEYTYAFLLDLYNLEPELLSHKSILF